jgi:beta-lactam-binding protein with PASTA domain
VSVPDVLGFRREAAEQQIREAGLEPVVRRSPSDRPQGTVFRQDPASGSVVEEGSTVTITVSSGPRQVEVPMLVGLTQQEAEDAIRDAGLMLGFVDEEESQEVEAGRVISQRPEPGTQIPEGSAVDIVVSTGAGQVAVPDIECRTFEEAQELLDERGLVLDVVEDQDRLNLECPDTEHVADQEPLAGELVDRGTTVTAFVIETAPEPSPTITPTGDGD